LAGFGSPAVDEVGNFIKILLASIAKGE